MTSAAARVRDLAHRAAELVPATVRATALLRAAGLAKIPLLLYIAPSVVDITRERCAVKIRLRRRTKNHLNVMYIGALVAGADCAGGLMAMQRIRESGREVDLLFKDFKANFAKRVEGDCLFICEDGAAIDRMVAKTIETGERVNGPLRVIAKVPDKLGDEPAAEFVLTLSLKRR